MTSRAKRFAVVFPPRRNLYEASYFRNDDEFEFVGLVDAESRTIVAEGMTVLKVSSVTPPPLGRIFTNVASPTTFGVGDRFLSSFDGFVVVESYGFISRDFARISERLSKKLVVITWETIANHPFYRFPPFSGNSRFVLEHANGIVAATRRAARAIGSRTDSERTPEVIYPGVDTDLFRPKDSQREHSTVRILYVGLLSKHKGFDLLLKAVSSMRSRLDADLTVVGGGPLKELLETRLGEGVKHLPWVSREELVNLYSESDIFVSLPRTARRFGLKTWEEQFGFTLVEAMSSSLPIVATDCGAVREIIGDANIIIPEDATETEVVSSIRRLVEGPDECQAIGMRNRALAEERYSMRKQARKFAAYLTGILNNDSSKS